ncbi:MAG: XTP/dITP diphosphatase [Deltaproteobacteria bacterium]|nr:XTP/dITP diphosphatase [Deltaproteobacteria bacterium]
MKNAIILGSGNEGKIKEFRSILGTGSITLFSWKDFDCPFSVREDGASFWENAFRKASLTAQITGSVSVADDSGLEVDYLNGRPGIFSARYAGAHATDQENNDKLLRELEGVPFTKRGARFVCAIVIFSPEGKWERVEGECRGIITENQQGSQGFGYDPIFLVPELGKTFAELSAEEKNRISHRARAIEKLRPLLTKYVS